MSFILEALKQAEQERGNGKLPSVMAVYHEAAEEQQSIDWKKWLAIAIFANAVILSAWIGWRLLSSSSNEVPVQTVDRDNQVSQEKVEIASPGFFAKSEQEQQAPPQKSEPLVVLEEQIDRSMITSKQIQTDEQKVTKEQSTSVETEVTEQMIATQLEPAVKLNKELEDSPQQVVTVEQTTADTIPEAEISVAKIEPLPVVEKSVESIAQDVVEEITEPEIKEEPVAIAARPEVPDFAELPYSLQQKIPDIRISVHIFNDVPIQRKARINGRIFREGEQVERGLVIEEITPRGVMFDYRGTVFRVSLR